MSIFNTNTPEEDADELSYTILSEELEKKAEEWYNSKLQADYNNGTYLYNAEKVNVLKKFSKVVLQYIWKRLGKKLPDLTRNYVDKNGEILAYKQND